MEAQKAGEVMKSSLQINPSETFQEVELSQEEVDAAILKAKREKAHRIKVKEYSDKVTAPRNIWTMNWSELGKLVTKRADELIPDYQDNGKLKTKDKFILDDHNGKIFTQLLYYFTMDVRFEGDLNRGLLLQGGVGVGKTLLMKMFMQNPLQSYGLVSCRKVADKYSDEGEAGVERNGETYGDGIVKYNGAIKLALNDDNFGHTHSGYCFDDLGTETIPAKHFGRDKNVMADVILNRYENANLKFTMTHVTTNLSEEEINNKYGSRVFDRIRQMFNVIQFSPNTKSKR